MVYLLCRVLRKVYLVIINTKKYKSTFNVKQIDSLSYWLIEVGKYIDIPKIPYTRFEFNVFTFSRQPFLSQLNGRHD